MSRHDRRVRHLYPISGEAGRRVTRERLWIFLFETPADHIESIIKWVRELMMAKYFRGQEEHGGELWAKPGSLKNLEEEITDLVIYYKTSKEQLRQMANEGKEQPARGEKTYEEA